jgi:hypothetical protein
VCDFESAGNQRSPHLYNVDPIQALGDWKSAWNNAREATSADFRQHELKYLRHTACRESRGQRRDTTAFAGHVFETDAQTLRPYVATGEAGRSRYPRIERF